MIAERIWTDRRLGSHTVATFTNDRIWLATGDNLRTGGDLASRSVWVRLGTPDNASPWHRAGASSRVRVASCAWPSENCRRAAVRSRRTRPRPPVPAGPAIGAHGRQQPWRHAARPSRFQRLRNVEM